MNSDIAHACATTPEVSRHQRVNAILRGLDVTVTKLADERADLSELIAAYEAAAADLAQLEVSA